MSEIRAENKQEQIPYKPLVESEVDKGIFEYLQKLSPPQKFMLARGMGQLKPAQLLIFTYILIGDKDERIAAAARDTFAKLPPNIVAPLFSGSIPSKVIDYAAKLWANNPDYKQALINIALNRNTSEFTLEHLIKHGLPEVVDVIANNQKRLMESPALIFAFAENPQVSVATVSRVLEFARREHLISAQDERKIIDKVAGVKAEAKAEEEEEPLEFPKDENGEPIFPKEMIEEPPEETIQEVIEKRREEEKGKVKSAEEIKEEIEKKVDIREKIRRMSVSEKLRLAVRGNMEVRNILIFDSVSLVAKAVVNSPRVTKLEIERWSAMRTMDEEILIEIAKNKEFLKSYQIRYNLVTNPRTPLSIASKLLNTLMEKDIKNIAKSKAVPQAIANIARQRLDVAKRRKEKRKK